VRQIDLGRAGQPTGSGNRLLGPWLEWLDPARDGGRLSLVAPPRGAVFSNDVKLAVRLTEQRTAVIEPCARMRRSLVIYTELAPAGAPPAAEAVLRDVLQFCGQWVERAAPRVGLDALPAGFGVDGLSLPGVVLVGSHGLDTADPLTIAHEAAHQFWGPQAFGGGPPTPLWTESAAEAVAITYLLHRRLVIPARAAVSRAFRLHRWLLGRLAPLRRCVRPQAADAPEKYGLVHGSGVLLYLCRLAALGHQRFGLALRRIAEPMRGGWRQWLCALDAQCSPGQFSAHPAGWVEGQLGAARPLLQVAFGAPARGQP
jgi:hypothetical protein